MRLLVYSYFQPLGEHHAGGAQRLLHSLLTGLAARRIDITVLCPRADEDVEPAHLPMRVVPRLYEPGRSPLPPHERQLNLQEVGREAAEADVVLSVDRALPLPVGPPVVLGVNNFSYGTEVDAVFSFCWDVVVTPSLYLQRCLAAVVGDEFWTGGSRPIAIVPPFIDQEQFRPDQRAAATLRAALGLSEDDRCLLWPHRPDPNKGFEMALDVLCAVRSRDDRFRLIVPAPPRSVAAVRGRQRAFDRRIRAQVARRGLTQAVVFHRWLDHSDMAAYYSLGDVTLALSRLPEGFGLTPLESISCGTPCVATPAGAIAELPLEGAGLHLVSFGAVEEAAAAVLSDALREGLAEGRREIAVAYPRERFINGWERILREAQKSHALYVPAPSREDRVAPWYGRRGGRWHDYAMRALTPGEHARPRDERLSQGVIIGNRERLPQ
jgi:glycosyltransferase involved in cell wall biosynthesis